ncbi:TonB-dependent receptor [Caulobacter sp. 73W]|uniref:TonB-dependent receptor n=1 Tax=Caulobacter sp. 73W TaxID=3161137 RepID=A0AB39KPM3_9CAUL
MRTSNRRIIARAKAALLGATFLSGGLTSVAFAQAEPANDSTVEEVVVTGFRGALISSTNAKRELVGFSDSIFAEDIGKFPDLNLAESLNRIPGVQLTREINGEGLNVSVRGLGTNFTKVLLNGAQIAVASSGRTDLQNQNREVDLDLFPTELFTRLDVNKTPVASTVEGGVAGVVNMRSARPFDYKDRQITYSLQGSYNSIAEKVTPRGSLIMSDTWETGIGEVGVLAGVAFVRNKSCTDGFETIGWTNANLTCPGCNTNGGNGFNFASTVPAGVTSNGLVPGSAITPAVLQSLNPGTSLVQLSDGLIPRLGRELVSYGDRDRNSALLSLEWRPNDKLNFYFDTLYGKANREFQRIDMNWIVRNSNAMVPVGVQVDSNNIVTKGTFLNSQFFLEYRPYDEEVEFYNFNPGGTWRPNDWLRVDAQANLSRSIFFREAPTVLINSPFTTVEYDNTSGPYPSIKSSLDLNNPNVGWQWAGGRVNIQNEKRVTSNKGARIDVTFGAEDGVNVRAGVSYDDVGRTIQALDNSARWQQAVCGGGGITPTGALPTPAAPCNGQAGSLIPQSALAGYIVPGPTNFITFDPRIMEAAQFDAYNSVAPFTASAATGAASGLVGEKTKGAYIEINGLTQVLDRDLRFNAGVRYYDTNQLIEGPQTVNGVLSFLSRETDYDGFLPAFNAVWQIRDNINVRFAASRTITRANPSAMLPGTVFSDPSAQNATQGNPGIQPYISNNFDIGGEWYTGGEGYIGVALFTKEITGFTVQGNTTIPFNQLGIAFDQLTQLQQQAITNRGGPDAATVTVTQQINANGILTIDGAEVTWVQPLDFLVEGAGFTANLTKIEQRGRGTGAPAVAVGISPWTYNVTGYYERGPASIRLSYVWNDAQISSGPNQNSVPVAQLRTDDRGQWDLSASYEFDWLPSQPRVTFDVINITNEAQRSTFEWDNAAFTYYKPGTTFLLGVRGKF